MSDITTFCGSQLQEGHRYCVMYEVDGRERRSAWFSTVERAELARVVIARRHGAAIVYID